jgi:uncharacterized repeat protein (TIGR02543 family)
MRRIFAPLLAAFLAVGASAAAVLFSAGPVGADITWGTANEVAASLNTGGGAAINAISCPSAGNCAAGGYYQDGSGHDQAFVVDEVAGVWQTASEVAGTLNVDGKAMILSVSCSSAGNCAAGGSYEDGAGHTQAFGVSEVAGVWGSPTEVAAALNAGGEARVISVSCSPDGSCAAGGYYEDGSGHQQAFVVTAWGTPTEVAGLLNSGGNAAIAAISCASAGNCAAGGYYEDGSGHTQAFVVGEVTSAWGTPSEVAGTLNQGHKATIASVSCPSAGNCTAGGFYLDGSVHAQAFVVDEAADAWGTPGELAASLNAGGEAAIASLSCASAGDCAAGGFYEDGAGHTQAFVAGEVTGVWGTPSEVAGTLNAGGDAEIDSVACSPAGNCAAGGYYEDGSGHTQAFVLGEVAGSLGTASEVAGTLNTGGEAAVASVSCSSDGNCAGGGYYVDGAAHERAFVIAQSHTVSFNANGGSGSMSAETASAPTALTASTFTRTGYTFAHWNSAADGSGATYANGAIYQFNADVTLYARWHADSEDVTFKANGGKGTMDAESYRTGVAKALTANAFTRTDHRFLRWNTAANGSGTAYANGESITIDSALTLYAQWKVEPQPQEILKVHPASVRFGATVHVHARLLGKNGAVSGTVHFSVAGATFCSVRLVAGIARCSVDSLWLGRGRHRIIAKFAGSTTYGACSKSVFVRVR